MTKLLTKEQKILEKVNAYWNRTVRSNAWREWFNTAVRCEAYKGGNVKRPIKNTQDHYSAELKSHITDDPDSPDYNPSATSINSVPDAMLSINMIEPYVNLIVGEYLKNDISVTVRAFEPYNDSKLGMMSSTTSREELELYVNAHNAELYKNYEQSNVNYYHKRNIEDICTYGLCGGFFDVVDGVKKFERINPLYIVPDIRDESIGFDNSEFVGHLIPMPAYEALKKFPKLSKLVKCDDYTEQSPMSAARFMMNGGLGNQVSDGNIVLVRMVEWKEYEKSYSGIAKNGRKFTVFDEDLAEEFLLEGRKLHETTSQRIHRAYFVDGLLLHHSALDIAQPRDQFSLVLCCLTKRSSSEGFYIPKGIVENLTDIHDALLINLTKATYLSFAKKVIVSKEALDNHYNSTAEEIKNILAAPISVLVANDVDRDYKDISHQQHITNHLNFVHEWFQIADRVSGINREEQGLPTNAHSGIAIRQRQSQSVTSILNTFYEFSSFKKKVGKLFLQTLQMEAIGSTNIFYPRSIRDLSDIEPFNVKNEKNGKLQRDINFLPLDVYIDETRRYLSSKEAQFDFLIELSQSPLFPFFMKSKLLLERVLPMPLDNEIIEEMVRLSGIEQAIQQLDAIQGNQASQISTQG